MAKHGLAIMVLEHKARDYNHTAFEGEYRYGDPENEVARWKEMAQDCLDGAEALKALG